MREAFGPNFDPDARRAKARSIAEASASTLAKAGVKARPAFLEGFVVRQVAKLVDDEDADLLIVGSKGEGPWRRLLVGSVADGLKNSVSRSVLIAKSAEAPTRILAAVDGSRESMRAAQAAADLAQAFGADLTFLSVLPDRGRKLVSRKRMHEIADLESRFRVGEVRPRLKALFGRAAETIVSTAQQQGAELIVMGSRGLTGLRTVVPGGVSNRVAHAASCSVLLVKTET